jgi:hypothetical protein
VLNHGREETSEHLLTVIVQYNNSCTCHGFNRQNQVSRRPQAPTCLR